MSQVCSLRIRLGEQDVGSLFELEDGQVGFAFDEAYATASMRPVLSQSYESARGSDVATGLLGEGRRELPPFFQNLLPEGALRRHLAKGAELSPDDELGLLALCGKGLPGDISAVEEPLFLSALPSPSAETISGSSSTSRIRIEDLLQSYLSIILAWPTIASRLRKHGASSCRRRRTFSSRSHAVAMSMQSVTSKQRLVHAGQLESPV